MYTQTYTFKKVGRCEIHADVHRVDTTPAHAPIIIFIHGGALIYGSRKSLNRHQAELYLEAGYVIMAIDYRLAPETKLPQIVSDVTDAFEWARTNGPELFGVDPNRMVTVGHSGGGYLALLAGLKAKPRPRAVVSFYGYGDIVGDWYTRPDPFYCTQPAVTQEESGVDRRGPVISEPYDGRGKDKFYLYCRQHGTWPKEVAGRDPITDSAFFAGYCPLRNISSDYPPTMLLHGEQDTDVPYEQSVLMANELEHHGVAHEFISMEEKGHGFDSDMSDPANIGALERAIAFLNAHSAPKPS